ncbi:MAG: hypothetical protein ACI9RV_002619, partial [Glaciecola sp.]
ANAGPVRKKVSQKKRKGARPASPKE